MIWYIGAGIIAFYAIWILAMTIMNYRMLKYLTGGRSWAGRWKAIQEHFTRRSRHG